MSDFSINLNNLKTAVNRAAGKAAVKVEEFGNKAAEGIHRKALSTRLSAEYEQLGRLVYLRLSDKVAGGNILTSGNDELADKIAGVMKNIEKLESVLAKLNAEKNDGNLQ